MDPQALLSNAEQGVKAGHKPGSVHTSTEVDLKRVGGYLSGTAVTDGLVRSTWDWTSSLITSLLDLASGRGWPFHSRRRIKPAGHRHCAPIPTLASKTSSGDGY